MAQFEKGLLKPTTMVELGLFQGFQRAINAFAATVGTKQIAIDGVIGPDTVTAYREAAGELPPRFIIPEDLGAQAAGLQASLLAATFANAAGVKPNFRPDPARAAVKVPGDDQVRVRAATTGSRIGTFKAVLGASALVGTLWMISRSH